MAKQVTAYQTADGRLYADRDTAERQDRTALVMGFADAVKTAAQVGSDPTCYQVLATIVNPAADIGNDLMCRFFLAALRERGCEVHFFAMLSNDMGDQIATAEAERAVARAADAEYGGVSYRDQLREVPAKHVDRVLMDDGSREALVATPFGR